MNNINKLLYITLTIIFILQLKKLLCRKKEKFTINSLDVFKNDKRIKNLEIVGRLIKSIKNNNKNDKDIINLNSDNILGETKDTSHFSYEEGPIQNYLNLNKLKLQYKSKFSIINKI